MSRDEYIEYKLLERLLIEQSKGGAASLELPDALDVAHIVSRSINEEELIRIIEYSNSLQFSSNSVTMVNKIAQVGKHPKNVKVN